MAHVMFRGSGPRLNAVAFLAEYDFDGTAYIPEGATRRQRTKRGGGASKQERSFSVPVHCSRTDEAPAFGPRVESRVRAFLERHVRGIRMLRKRGGVCEVSVLATVAGESIFAQRTTFRPEFLRFLGRLKVHLTVLSAPVWRKPGEFERRLTLGGQARRKAGP